MMAGVFSPVSARRLVASGDKMIADIDAIYDARYMLGSAHDTISRAEVD